MKIFITDDNKDKCEDIFLDGQRLTLPFQNILRLIRKKDPEWKGDPSFTHIVDIIQKAIDLGIDIYGLGNDKEKIKSGEPFFEKLRQSPEDCDMYKQQIIAHLGDVYGITKEDYEKHENFAINLLQYFITHLTEPIGKPKNVKMKKKFQLKESEREQEEVTYEQAETNCDRAVRAFKNIGKMCRHIETGHKGYISTVNVTSYEILYWMHPVGYGGKEPASRWCKMENVEILEPENKITKARRLLKDAFAESNDLYFGYVCNMAEAIDCYHDRSNYIDKTDNESKEVRIRAKAMESAKQVLRVIFDVDIQSLADYNS